MAVGNETERQVLKDMAKHSLGRPAGSNPEWTHMQPFSSIDNATIWPFSIDIVKDGIAKEQPVLPENIKGRGAFMDMLVMAKNQPVFVDLKGILRAPFFGSGSSKIDLYTGNQGKEAVAIADGNDKQDYILVLVWNEWNDSKVQAINVSKCWQKIGKNNPSGCSIIWGNKTVNGNTYDRIRFSPNLLIPWSGSPPKHHANVHHRMRINGCASAQLVYKPINIILAIEAVM
tara:strand:+ start:214 stop:903 length:690 start_codon:yes stop_codon:yes gene_type:complete